MSFDKFTHLCDQTSIKIQLLPSSQIPSNVSHTLSQSIPTPKTNHCSDFFPTLWFAFTFPSSLPTPATISAQLLGLTLFLFNNFHTLMPSITTASSLPHPSH